MKTKQFLNNCFVLLLFLVYTIALVIYILEYGTTIKTVACIISYTLVVHILRKLLYIINEPYVNHFKSKELILLIVMFSLIYIILAL
jgi:hypothetical protein